MYNDEDERLINLCSLDRQWSAKNFRVETGIGHVCKMVSNDGSSDARATLHTEIDREPRPDNPLPDTNPTKVKCHKYRRQFELWIDYNVLRSSLKWNDPEFYRLFPKSSHGDRNRENLIDDLWTYFNSRGDSGYEELIDCLKHSLKELSFVHLGHDSLVTLLSSASEESFFESNDFICNMAIEEIVRNKINTFIEMTDVNKLVPFLDAKGLLTFYDKPLLDNKTEPEKANHLLTELLYTKGHRGYIIFFECLIRSVNGREHYHAGHYDIIKEIELGLKNKGLHIGNSTGKRGVPL